MGLTFVKDILPVITNKGVRHTFLGEETLDGFIVNTNGLYQCSWLIFENVRFTNQFFLSDQFIGIGLKFIGCTFENTVTLNNIITAKDSDVVFDSENRNIVFIDCKFIKKFEITGNKTSIDNEIHFFNCVFSDNIIIENITVVQLGIKFANCKVEGSVLIQKNKLNQRLQIIDSSINGSFNVDNLYCDMLEIISCTFHSFLTFTNNYFKSVFSYYESIFHDAILMRNNESPGTLIITGGEFKKQIRVSYSDIQRINFRGFNKLHIIDAAFLNGFYLSGDNKFFQVPNSGRMECVTIKCSSILTGDIHFEKLDICELMLSGFNAKANLVFNQVLINGLIINDFFNNAELVFSKVESSYEDWYYSENGTQRKPSGLFITESNLGKTHLFQVGLNTYEIVEIKNVIFSEIITSNVSWFEHDKIKIKNEATKAKEIKFSRRKSDIPTTVRNETILLDEISTRREIYRQLKYAMEKNGDRPLALEFQSIEMDYYRKLVKLKRGNFLKERFILWSSLSNDFGQNWFRPTLLLLISTFILYLPIAFCVSNQLQFTPVHSRFELMFTLKELFWYKLKLIPHLLNPVHNISALTKDIDKVPGVIYFLDFLDRLFVAYFVFQIVTAFRKYVR